MAADTAVAPDRRRWLGLAVLAVAVVAAAGMAFFLLLSGDDGSAAGDPERVVRDFYRAVDEDDLESFEAALDPALADNPARQLIPFGSTAGAYDVGHGERVELDDLTTELINEEAGWASVAVSGRARIEGTTYLVQETQYLRQLADGWAVSSAAIFFAENSGDTPDDGGSAELGPIDPQRPEVGEPAPDFALVDARDGTTVRKLSDFRGKAVVVNWYASWCGPCKDEIPEFQAAYEALPQELVFLGVNFLESQTRAISILDDYNAEYPAVLDSRAEVADHYRVGNGIPTTFFVDKDGVLTGIHYGEASQEDLVAQLAKAGVTYTP